ncbi:hypothetical protein GCK72_007866 [Caenorhabditis remanei]|uniref:F-box associated domain-containing protein n=1 Tax=Caenorhabditis remanei TaxID=31234 RepID=A0A6A5HML5_CAERE|nr:hypothetical protein GCK72_007866 [Caenorhabditis remanei]KAF1767906.1 hypothetical protein GCK72_007866 [Caenorhabditis remanei]
MENQEVLRSKPLSYEASKAVLKSLSLETREAINRRIPALRTVNSRLPYVLENVVIGTDTFETNGREWFMRPVWVQSSENPLRKVEDPEKWELILQFNQDTKKCYRVNKSPEEILEQLFDEYIRDGTVVRGSLCLIGIPEFMKRKSQNEVDLKMKVTNLELNTFVTTDYDQFFWFIDLYVLENVRIIELRNSLTLLDNPEIKTCKKLTIEAVLYGLPSVDQLLRLRNQHLQLENYGLTLHELQLFVQDWITTGREVGTRFSWAQKGHKDVRGILYRLKTHFSGVEAGSNLDYYFFNKTIHGKGITLKMGEDRELVMYCDQREPQSEWTIYIFEMEVVSSTTSAGSVPTPDV